MLRVVIVDDEHLARQAMRRLLTGRADVEIVGEAETLAEAQETIARLAPDLVFLDIELGGGDDGFALLASLERPPAVVFVTAYAQHAVEAFAVAAADYLLKPVEPARLAESLRRVERQLALRARPAAIELKTPKRTLLAQPENIAALVAEGDFTRVFVAGEPPLMILRTLTNFESQLPSPPFLRLGRSVMVNRDRLRRIETPSRGTGLLTLDGMAEPLAIGRAAAQRLREALAVNSGSR